MTEGFEFKEKYNCDDLLRIMSILRAPGGCPWDAEQTHASIRSSLIEETYEAADAIDRDSSADLCEELGDILLQVVFHAQIEKEAGRFDFNDVADGICKKMILRHPHVFGDVTVNNSDDVLRNWDAIKKDEKRQKSYTDTLESVPRVLPALMRSEKLQHRAARAGMDMPNTAAAIEKLKEETAELCAAVESGNRDDISDELGDVLFSAVNVSRFTDVNAEEALYRACDKFTERFSRVESVCTARGTDMKSMNIDELDKIWEEVKKERL